MSIMAFVMIQDYKGNKLTQIRAQDVSGHHNPLRVLAILE